MTFRLFPRIPRAGVAAPDEPAQTAGPRRAAAAFAGRLTFQDVCRSFGEIDVLDHVSLDIAPGKIVCLLGPSGCGKTTLLRIASGVDHPTSGRVLIDDKEVAGTHQFTPPEKRNVGLVFQDFALFPHLTILDNVAFGLHALDATARRREALAILARVGLANFAAAYPDTLSGGQQQRVALARAIVPRPAVVLLDEPFSGLDIDLRDAMQEETLALLKETRATGLLVTHDPAEALRMGDAIAVMREGRLVQVGNGEDLYRAPADLFVARLFSEINELPGRVVGGAIPTPFGTFHAEGLPDGTNATLCIRRRAVRIVLPGEGQPGRVLATRFRGDSALLTIGVQGLDSQLTAVVPEAKALAPGVEVTVAVEPSGVLVLPGL
ncbi:MAG: ABC transporter ATP-binding protein [Pseudomonadota bacterium]